MHNSNGQDSAEAVWKPLKILWRSKVEPMETLLRSKVQLSKSLKNLWRSKVKLQKPLNCLWPTDLLLSHFVLHVLGRVIYNNNKINENSSFFQLFFSSFHQLPRKSFISLITKIYIKKENISPWKFQYYWL